VRACVRACVQLCMGCARKAMQVCARVCAHNDSYVYDCNVVIERTSALKSLEEFSWYIWISQSHGIAYYSGRLRSCQCMYLSRAEAVEFGNLVHS